MSEPTASEPRPGLSRLAAPLFLLPALLHLLGRGGEGWYLVLLALALARLAGGRSDARTWAAGVAFSFVLPLWPVIAHLFGFQLERVIRLSEFNEMIDVLGASTGPNGRR